jgi:hypothetical protein
VSFVWARWAKSGSTASEKSEMKKKKRAPRHNAAFKAVFACVHLGHVAVRVDGAEEDRLELVHTSVCELKSGVLMRDDRGRGHMSMCILGAEKVDKSLADALCRPLAHVFCFFAFLLLGHDGRILGHDGRIRLHFFTWFLRFMLCFWE